MNRLIQGGLKKMDRHKENLLVSTNSVYSYLTKVATINHKERTIKPLGWWSVTTTRHINYVGREYNYKVLDGHKLSTSYYI